MSTPFEDIIMKAYPCPYKTGEDLRKRRRKLQGLAHCGFATQEHPEDDAFVLKWKSVYAAAQADRKRIEARTKNILDTLDTLPED